jgi:AhpD family alkylhydroperoxidase
MENMKKVFDEVNLNLGKFTKEFPNEMEAFGKLMQAIEAPGALDAKHKELIAISLSIATHCKWCIAYHVKNALENGATRKEITEASWIAVLMGGGPSLMYMQLVEKSLEDYKK